MKLVGYADGQEIRFDFHPPDLFTAVLPANGKGTCVVELHAVDDAGNISSYCDSVVMINFDRMDVRVIDSQFLIQQQDSRFAVREIGTKYVHKELISCIC